MLNRRSLMIMQQIRKTLLFFTLFILASCSSLQKIIQTDPDIQTGPDIQTKAPQLPVWPENALKAFNQGNSLIKSALIKSSLTKNDSAQAIKAFRKAIKLAPKMEPAYFNLMRLYYEIKQFENMQQVLVLAQIQGTSSARMLSLSGSYQRQQGEFEKAEKIYQHALLADENSLSALVNMAILQDLYLHQLPVALSYYERYQNQLLAQQKQDKRLKNWLADLKQRINKLKQEKGE